MPLRALVNEQNFLAPLCESEAWESVRAVSKADRETVRTVCCSWPAVPRVSKLGTRHFAHRPGADCGASDGETVHHLQLKTLLVRALAARGWAANTEVAGDDWRADVLATKGHERVAFEVQWSSQEAGETVARSMRYADSGVRVVWLMRRLPGELAARADVPCFLVSQRGDEYDVAVGGRVLTVAELVDAYVNGMVRSVAAIVESRLAARAFAIDAGCDECGQQQVTQLGFESPLLVMPCGARLDAERWSSPGIEGNAARELRLALSSGEVVLDGVRGGGGQRGVSWRSSCRACDALAPQLSARSLAAAMKRPDALARQVYDYVHPARPGHRGDRHWCFRPDACAAETASADDGGGRAAAAVAAAARELAVASRTVTREVTLAGTTATTVVMLPDLRQAVVCAQHWPRGGEMRVQRARLRDIGYQAVWVQGSSLEDELESSEARDDFAVVQIGGGSNATTARVAERASAYALVRCLQAGGPVTAVGYRSAAAQRVDVYRWVQTCWKCQGEYTAVGVAGAVLSRCGEDMDDGMELSDRDVGPHIADALRNDELRARLQLGGAPVARVERRWSRTEEVRYWANVCPRCDALLGRYFSRQALQEL